MSPLQRKRAGRGYCPPALACVCELWDRGFRRLESNYRALFYLFAGRSHILSTQLKLTATTMTGKAKPKKHTAKEIAAKVDAATTNRGGGKAGLADRSGSEKGGHAKFVCPLCKTTAPDIKSMEIHHESKHPKIPFDETKLSNLHATHAVETSKTRPGIRGSFKK